MKITALSIVIILLSAGIPSWAAPGPKLAHMQMPFVEVRDAHGDVTYVTSAAGVGVTVTADADLQYAVPSTSGRSKAAVVSERFLGAAAASPRGDDRSYITLGFFHGAESSNWTAEAPGYGQVDMGERYDGITVKLRTNVGTVEKIFFVEPQADPGLVRIGFKGVSSLRVTGSGDMDALTSGGTLRFSRPVAYQDIGGSRRQVDVSYVVSGHEYGFRLGPYDKDKPLVIDPLMHASYLGGRLEDEAYALAVAPDGSVLVAGSTNSFLLHGSPPPETTGKLFSGDLDIFVARLDASLSRLLSYAIIGGSSPERAYRLAIDEHGDVLISGGTESRDYPTTPGSFDRIFNGGALDVFVTKVNLQLNRLISSTYLGGGKDDKAYAMALGPDGVYVAGRTFSGAGFPRTDGAYDTAYHGNGDGFIALLDRDLGILLASTGLGGTEQERIRDLAVAADGSVYAAGWTYSPDFPTSPDAFDESHNGSLDGFVSRLDAGLGTLLGSSFVGGSGEDRFDALAVAANKLIYVAGRSKSADYPTTPLAVRRTAVRTDGVLTLLDPELRSALGSTFIGGAAFDGIKSIALDASGSVYAAGLTASSDFPTTPGAFDTTLDGRLDMFVSRLAWDLSAIGASTYFGGSGTEAYRIRFRICLAVSESGAVYVTGGTNSPNLPTSEDAFDTSLGGRYDAFVAAFDDDL